MFEQRSLCHWSIGAAGVIRAAGAGGIFRWLALLEQLYLEVLSDQYENLD
jgi:hypothetical protein